MELERIFMLLLCLMPQQGTAQVTLTQTACGKNVALKCALKGGFNPDLSRLWFKGEEIILIGGVSISPRYSEITDSNYFELIVTEFTTIDEGTYRCYYGFEYDSSSVNCSAQTNVASEKAGGQIGFLVASVLVCAVSIFVPAIWLLIRLCQAQRHHNQTVIESHATTVMDGSSVVERPDDLMESNLSADNSYQSSLLDTSYSLLDTSYSSLKDSTESNDR